MTRGRTPRELRKKEKEQGNNKKINIGKHRYIHTHRHTNRHTNRHANRAKEEQSKIHIIYLVWRHPNGDKMKSSGAAYHPP